MDPSLRISLLGELAVTRNGTPVALPASRKARAVLGYLVATARPVRRERLCELFWDLPDDPRGSLRWALSKLRPAVDGTEEAHIVADRERVAFSGGATEVDLLAIRARLLDEPPFLPPEDLREMAAQLEQPLLDGLAQAGAEDFQLWLASEREDALLLRRNVLRRLALHPEIGRAEAVKWARRWKEQTPLEEDAARSLVQALAQTGREDEARQHESDFFAAAKAAGLSVSGPLMPEASVASGETAHHSRPVEARPRRLLRKQQIGFCRSSDGVRIAHASIGDGPPLVKAANWLNHLELDCNSPIWGPTFDAWAMDRRFIRYDERGNGLSDWDVKDITFEAFVRDLETVVDALGLERFPLLGISQGCAVSVAYAARHPERVSGLILVAGYATGWRIGASAEEQARREAVLTLTRHGWGTSNPAYRHIFSQTFMPDARPEDLEWFDEFQRLTVSPENAVRFQVAFGTIDVREDLPKIQVPTIVFHARDDERIALDQGRALAAGIPGAEFVVLDSKNHILLGHEPAWHACMNKAKAFLAHHNL
ncbi:alpha/beta fold hydrolase [uncultured Roseobacter sp.]|uniref:alpha/beta fold hydrolase n=1 Tax=uncultured Roseobacter sp. TaxID=114847 RepID=UPI00260DDEB5|nr:alpha/beta fold hydrolase [uncultured Roseobacter sp.]